MRESEKRRRAPKLLQKKTLLIKQSPPPTVSGLRDFVVKAPLQNYKNNIAKPITMGGGGGGGGRKKTKRDKKQKRTAGIQQGRMNSG